MAKRLLSQSGLRRLIACDSGSVVTSELVTLTVVAVVGLIVAFTAM